MNAFLNDKLSRLALLSIFTCGCIPENSPPEITYVDDSAFEEAQSVPVQVADGFEIELWAPGPLLSNAVSLCFDYQGVAYVSETSRRKSSDIDIREHSDWMTEDLALETLEDTKAFHLRKLATELSDQNTWQEDFNGDSLHDYRDLEVQSEYIRRLWDSDNDGRADASSLFAEGFNTMLTGVAAGILHHNGEIFLTLAPDLWRLKDLDGDGDADQRESLSHGYGVHIGFAGHDMSGLTIGPDGKIYWSIGDLGLDVVDQTGKRWSYPNQGAVMRANPDGSDFEVFAHGLRNPQELAFDAYGNLFTVDNDGDHAGEHERYVHILEGSDSGWRTNWQYGKYDNERESYKVWMDEGLHEPHFKGQAAYILPPLALAPNGPAGLAYNPGTALSALWDNYFFSSYFTGASASSKIEAFRLKPKGASFALDTVVEVLSGIVPTGVTFGPDGALYINDWKETYDKKPEGRIWKLDVSEGVDLEQRQMTRQILSKGMKALNRGDLRKFMDYPDMRVRMEAQFELVRRKERKLLRETALSGQSVLARLHGIWGIGQLARKQKNTVAQLLPLLDDPNAEIRAQTAKIIGEAKYEPALLEVLNLLNDTSARVQLFTVEALGKLASPEAFEDLVNLLEQTEDSDPAMRHAISLALSRLNDEGRLKALQGHPDQNVRIGAVVALRRLQSSEVAVFLADKHPLVVTEAARAVHDDFSIPEALPALADILETTTTGPEAFLRRAINANLRLGKAENARLLASFSGNEAVPVAMRIEALYSLAYWPEEVLLDRVDNRYRELAARNVEDARAALMPYYSGLLKVSDQEVKIAAIFTVGNIRLQAAEPRLLSLFNNKKEGIEVRKEVLKALVKLESRQLESVLNLALSDQNRNMRETAQSLLGEIQLPEPVKVSLLETILNHNSIVEKQVALQQLSLLKSNEAKVLLEFWFDQWMKGTLDPELQLDVWLAVENSSFSELKSRLNSYKKQLESKSTVQQYSTSLFGGNVQTGKTIFSQNSRAQCMRCHILNGEGGEAGPDLTGIAGRLSREELLLSLVEPDARLAPGYGAVIVNLTNGKEVAGLLLEEQEQFIRIRDGQRIERRIDRSEIEKMEILPSGMLNMKGLLSRDEIRDLMAFLVTLE